MDTDNVHEAAVSKRNFPRRSKAMKKVMKKMLIAGMACVCGAALLAGCGGDSDSKSGGEKHFLNFATGGTAGTYYPLGGALAELLNNNIKGMNASAQSTGASVANVNMLKDGSVVWLSFRMTLLTTRSTVLKCSRIIKWPASGVLRHFIRKRSSS